MAPRSLGLFQTAVFFLKTGFSGAAEDEFVVEDGGRLYFTLNVKRIDPGASVAIKVLNSFSQDYPEDERLSFSLSAIGIRNRSLSDFHNRFKVTAVVTGGTADFAVAVTCADNALAGASSAPPDSGGTPPVDPGGAPVYFDDEVAITPGAEQTLIDETVPDGIIRSLNKLLVSCRFEGSYVVLVDGDLAGSGLTGPADVNSSYEWNPPRQVEAGSNIKVKFIGRVGIPATVTVKSHLQCSDADAVG